MAKALCLWFFSRMLSMSEMKAHRFWIPWWFWNSFHLCNFRGVLCRNAAITDWMNEMKTTVINGCSGIGNRNFKDLGDTRKSQIEWQSCQRQLHVTIRWGIIVVVEGAIQENTIPSWDSHPTYESIARVKNPWYVWLTGEVWWCWNFNYMGGLRKAHWRLKSQSQISRFTLLIYLSNLEYMNLSCYKI